jgi:hypothetical protein
MHKQKSKAETLKLLYSTEKLNDAKRHTLCGDLWCFLSHVNNMYFLHLNLMLMKL